MEPVWLLSLLVFAVSFLYASVGHGGASGYLAIMSFFVISSSQMASTALVLNLLVAGIAFYQFSHAGYFSFKLTYPFVIASVPLSFIGGLIPLTDRIYFLLLAAVLLYFACHMFIGSLKSRNVQNSLSHSLSPTIPPPKLSLALPLAGTIGLLSGMIGIGGGIFLSPLMIMFKWADPKHTAATSAGFIVANSFAGLIGRSWRGGFVLTTYFIWLLTAGVIGSWLGAQLGAQHWPGNTLRKVLAMVLLLAALKMLVTYWH